jgi:hypothetical protein
MTGMDVFWTVVQAALLAAIPGIAYLARELYLKWRAERTVEQQALLDTWAERAVLMAEQVLGAGWGEQKKQMAVDYVQAKFDARKWKINVGEIAAAIEAAVYDQFTRDELAARQVAGLPADEVPFLT